MKLPKDISPDKIFEMLHWISEVSRLFDNLGTIKKVYSSTGTIDFASISANSNDDQTMTVTGVTAGSQNVVIVGIPSTVEAQLTITGFVSNTDEVTLRAHNTSGGAVNPASATYRVTVITHE